MFPSTGTTDRHKSNLNEKKEKSAFHPGVLKTPSFLRFFLTGLTIPLLHIQRYARKKIKTVKGYYSHS